MTSGWLLLGVITLVCVTDLAIAFYLSRVAGRTPDDFGAPSPKIDPAKARTMSRALFIMAPLIWLFIAALTFGLFGPIHGITPIKL